MVEIVVASRQKNKKPARLPCKQPFGSMRTGFSNRELKK
jgi:hypothetical protein